MQRDVLLLAFECSGRRRRRFVIEGVALNGSSLEYALFPLVQLAPTVPSGNNVHSQTFIGGKVEGLWLERVVLPPCMWWQSPLPNRSDYGQISLIIMLAHLTLVHLRTSFIFYT